MVTPSATATATAAFVDTNHPVREVLDAGGGSEGPVGQAQALQHRLGVAGQGLEHRVGVVGPGVGDAETATRPHGAAARPRPAHRLRAALPARLPSVHVSVRGYLESGNTSPGSTGPSSNPAAA